MDLTEVGEGSPLKATEVVVSQYAQAYMLTLLSSFLLPSKSGTDVRLFILSLLQELEEVDTFSWGRAILAYLHHE